MEIVTSWMERGIEQGREREARSLILRQLSRRFGSLSSIQVTAIENLNLTQLEVLSEALLDFTTVADLDAWLQQW
ncbi:MAG: DUF4351 domain-containing protein [Jaaginema sp. PMC 1079.18]|nr:DUF4351 domain-containing protein [Jaaginema sp. PMC 1079.18]